MDAKKEFIQTETRYQKSIREGLQVIGHLLKDLSEVSKNQRGAEENGLEC